MAFYNLAAGSISAFYLGDHDDGQPLRKILSQRTGGITIQDNMPRAYVPGSNTQLQAGLHTVTLNVTFLAEDVLTWKLAKGISVYGDHNDSCGNQKYSIFLLYSDRRFAKSFWFPEMQVVSPLNINYNKDRPTILPITLVGTNRDPDHPLIYRDKWTNFTNNYYYPSFQMQNPLPQRLV